MRLPLELERMERKWWREEEGSWVNRRERWGWVELEEGLRIERRRRWRGEGGRRVDVGEGWEELWVEVAVVERWERIEIGVVKR